MSETVSGEELEKINGYAREPLTEDKVFVFRVALCDNDIDRDGEKFSSGALEKLAELFKGRTGIFDHDPKSSKQTARIFDTWVETLPEKTTTDGEVYRRLMAKAYMVRTASNGDLISEIQGGIKKEVSVSCTMGKKLCSVCGADRICTRAAVTMKRAVNTAVSCVITFLTSRLTLTSGRSWQCLHR